MNEIIDIEPDAYFITFRRPDDVIVFVCPSIHRDCWDFSYSNHPNAAPTVLHDSQLVAFRARNPHIALALDDIDAAFDAWCAC